MVKNFNKNSSKNPENSSSTNWDISPEEQQEIAQYREQTINSAESGDIDMLNGAAYSGGRRNILDNIRTALDNGSLSSADYTNSQIAQTEAQEK